MWKFISILSVFIFLIGCATPRVYVNGLPLPNSTYIERNPETKIKVDIYGAKMVEKENSNGDIYYSPEFFNIGEEHKIDPENFDHLTFHFRVSNPDRHTYQTRVQYHLKNGSSYEMFERDGYKGNVAREEYSINYGQFDSCDEVSIFLIVDWFKNGERKGKVFKILLLRGVIE